MLLDAAFRPKPRRANASHSSFWLAPPNRIWSAASIALRASTIDGAGVISRYESNSSWIQRRLPGQRSTATWPLAHCSCSAWSLSGDWPLYFAASALRTSKFVAVQISPSACDPRAGHVVAESDRLSGSISGSTPGVGNAPVRGKLPA